MSIEIEKEINKMLYVTFTSHGFVRNGEIVREVWMGQVLRETYKVSASGAHKYYVIKQTHDGLVTTIKVDQVREYVFSK